ncbi:glycosyltransferase family 2 protein [Ornithobacterium rhinotracheale]|uniref:glycosyltransferase family 2 protein n=1 Tax=Ornithobacterium rhinotracheale TaxID=28251 RepID=UPI0040350EC0
MKLSIIIPVYNCAEYLKPGFEKLRPVYDFLKESEFEIIYVNDGSNDSSLEELKKISSENSNVIIIDQENQGSSGARNTAIDVAKGDYIQFLDADDYIDFGKVIPLLNICFKENLDSLSYRIGFIDSQGELTGEMEKHPVTFDRTISGEQALIEGFHPSSICCWLFKTDFFNKKNLRIYPKITHMDVEFTTRMLVKSKRVMFKDIIAYFYVSRPGSITKPKTMDKLKKFLYDEVTVATLVKNNITPNMSKDLKMAIEKNYNAIVWNLLWRFYKKSNEVDKSFKQKCIQELKEKKLYPIKGPMKTRFQRLSKHLMNNSLILKNFILK